jgi:dUTP pyrophosphatase
MEFFQVKRLSETAKIPKRGSQHAAGYDLYADENTFVPAMQCEMTYVNGLQQYKVYAGSKLVSTNIAISIPHGYYARGASRSGLAVKNSIEVGAGVIDSDYRGEVKVLLRNHGASSFEIKQGDRIAQLIIEKIITPDPMEVEELSDTLRGAGGFGSTGVALDPANVESFSGGLDLSENFPQFNPDGTPSQWAFLYEPPKVVQSVGHHIDQVKQSCKVCMACRKIINPQNHQSETMCPECGRKDTCITYGT